MMGGFDRTGYLPLVTSMEDTSLLSLLSIVRLRDRIHAVHKEILLLVLLCAGTVPLFLFTRAAATLNRDIHAGVADFWYQNGVGQLQKGNAKASIESFR